ncbi:MAG: hypothetical protein H0W55_04145 [Actinobacteria bacterium]|nr:hypothetical protein [Actinomycetota bacterium]MDQ3531082.1 hypothetical protein [Actinomycetota bacterium]
MLVVYLDKRRSAHIRLNATAQWKMLRPQPTIIRRFGKVHDFQRHRKARNRVLCSG